MCLKSKISKVMVVIVIGVSICIPLVAEATPELTGDIKAVECIDAFQFARSAYNSRASRLYSAPEIPIEMDSEMILGTLAFDISGGDALEVNEAFFEILPHGNRSIYWDKSAAAGVRIVVQEDPFGWRGDTYSLYLIPANEPKSRFSSDIDGNYEVSEVPSLFGEMWRPPLVFRHKTASKLWFITVGEPYEVLSDWAVYLQASQGFEQGCKIVFRSGSEGEISSLPRTVQRLVGLLNDTLGPGLNEGTLQPTATIRNQVRHIWANAALRPWALSDRDRYNSQEEVDLGLEKWSKNGPSYKNVYRKIKATYPLAEQDLAEYYKQHFHLKSSDAGRLAKWVLEIAYCANYSFSNGQDYFRYDNVDNNPWESIRKK
jgi:hypothetical protein